MAFNWNTAFWNPNSNYGADYDWYDTPLVNENEPDQGAFLRFVTGQGLAGNSNKAQFAQSLYNRTQSGYDAASSSNPMMTYRDYLSQLGPNFADQLWDQLGPQARGEDPTSNNAGRIRILGRG